MLIIEAGLRHPYLKCNMPNLAGMVNILLETKPF